MASSVVLDILRYSISPSCCTSYRADCPDLEANAFRNSDIYLQRIPKIEASFEKLLTRIIRKPAHTQISIRILNPVTLLIPSPTTKTFLTNKLVTCQLVNIAPGRPTRKPKPGNQQFNKSIRRLARASLYLDDQTLKPITPLISSIRKPSKTVMLLRTLTVPVLSAYGLILLRGYRYIIYVFIAVPDSTEKGSKERGERKVKLFKTRPLSSSYSEYHSSTRQYGSLPASTDSQAKSATVRGTMDSVGLHSMSILSSRQSSLR